MYKVIIIEDEDLIRKGIAYTFNWLEYDCVVVGEAQNGKEGIMKIKSLKPDIVITDIKMPILNGLEMLKSIEERFFETIIITGHAEFQYAKQAIKLGVSDFILKPIDENELAEIIIKLTKKIKKESILERIHNQVQDLSEFEIFDYKFYLDKSNLKSKYVADTIEIIINNYNRKITIEEIAEKVGVSPSYLSKKFKKETGHAFNDFLNKYRIHDALIRIQNSNDKIYEIAEKVGFSDYKYFSQVFKNYIKYSPTEFMNLDVIIKKKVQ